MNKELAAYQSAGGSVVSVTRGRGIGHLVEIDNIGGMCRLAGELAAQGYTSFGVIAGPRRLLSVRDRLEGIKQGLKAHGITLAKDDIVYGDMSREGGLAGAQVLMNRPRPPRCIMAVADVVAFGAMSWLRNEGIEMPAEVAVSGFGGLPASVDAVPSLTTFELPLERVGETAMELALRPASPRHVVEIEGSLVLRDSTAKPG